MSIKNMSKNGIARNRTAFEKVGADGLAKRFDISLDEVWTYLENKEIATRPNVVIDSGPEDSTVKRGRGRPAVEIDEVEIRLLVDSHLDYAQMSKVLGFSVPTIQKRVSGLGLARSRGAKRSVEEIETANAFVTSTLS